MVDGENLVVKYVVEAVFLLVSVAGRHATLV
jgi:hypothetical protein